MRARRVAGRAALGAAVGTAVGVVPLVGCGAVEDATPEPPPALRTTVVARTGDGGPGGFLVGDVRDGLILEGGGFAVASAIDHRVHLFDRHGEHVRSLGGEGEGPGEFESVHGVGEIGDGRIVVWDPQLARETVFGPGGDVDVVRTVDVDGYVENLPSLLGWAPSGEMLLTRTTRGMYALREHPTGPRRDTVRVLEVSRAEAEPVEVLSLVGEEEWFWNADGSWGQRPLLFGSELKIALSDGAIVAARTGEGSVTVFDRQGRQLSRYVVPGPARSPDPDRVTRERRRVAEAALHRARGIPVAVPAWSVRERVEAIPVAERLPALPHAAPHPGRGVWIGLGPDEGAGDAAWTLFDTGGHPVGTVGLLPGDQILDARGRRLLIRRTDDLDVESVVLVAVDLPEDPGAP